MVVLPQPPEQGQAFARRHRQVETLEQNAIAAAAAQLLQAQAAHPFTAPWVRPRTIQRWATSTSSSRGRLPSTVAAAKAP